jgi:hypothetical protein
MAERASGRAEPVAPRVGGGPGRHISDLRAEFRTMGRDAEDLDAVMDIFQRPSDDQIVATHARWR